MFLKKKIDCVKSLKHNIFNFKDFTFLHCSSKTLNSYNLGYDT